MVSGKLGYLTLLFAPVVSAVLTINAAEVYVGLNAGSGQAVSKSTADLTTTSATNLRVDKEIVLVFSEAVARGAASKTITLTDASGSSTYSFLEGAASATDAVISANKVTIQPMSSGVDLLELTTYTIEVQASMFKDVATGTKFNSLLTAYFVTGDFTRPAITHYNPPQFTTNVAVNSNMVLTFSETVQAVSTGAVQLQNYHAAYISNSASTPCNLLTFSGNTVTIVPSSFYTFNGGALEHCSMFQITMTGLSGCITDASPNANVASFGDISTPTPPPVPSALGTYVTSVSTGNHYLFWSTCIVSVDPPNGMEDVLINSSITITFSENVQAAASGVVYVTPRGYTRGTAGGSLEYITYSGSQVVINAQVVTITPSAMEGLCSDGSTTLKDTSLLSGASGALGQRRHQYQDCKGKPFDVEIYGVQPPGVTPTPTQVTAFMRDTPQSAWDGIGPSGYTDYLPTQLTGSDYTYTLEPNDYTPPTMTIVSMYGISETVIRVTVRLDESGTVYCQAYTRSPSTRTMNPTIFEIGDPVNFASGGTNVQQDCDAGNHNACMRAVYDAQYGFAETEVDISTTYYPAGTHPTGGSSLIAETMYDVYCYALDATLPEVTSGVSEANVVNSATMLATKKIVRTLDMTPPTFNSFSCATTGENSVTATLEMSEWGTSYCKVVHKDHPAPSPNAVIAEGFSYVFTGTLGTTFDIVVNEITTGLGSTGRESLRLKTDYDLYCWAQDDEGYPYYGPNGMAAAVKCSQSPLTTFDLTRPKMRYITAESVSRSQIHITLQVDEGSKVWCAAWKTDPTLGITAGNDNYITAIKDIALPGNQDCMDIHKNSCGNFWIYDLDDIEDGDASDNVIDQATYDAALWKQDRDVEILLNNLEEEVDYQYIYCHAEDDETALSQHPNVMQFDMVQNQGPDNVWTIRNAFGTVQTLDESMPLFRQLEINDPTANNDRIIVTFTLNEDGTAYCRVTRSDSGETNLKINRILTADWSNVYDHTNNPNVAKTITITSLENALYSDPIIESQEYDIYCWAKDSAVDTAGNARPNYQTQSYVNQLVTAPLGLDNNSDNEPDYSGGGTTKNVWVVDSTPPTMIFVSGEAIAEDRIQLTLQLNEPGTIWCTPVAKNSAATSEIKNSDFGTSQFCHDNAATTNPAPTPTYYENCIKGATNGATFVVYVPEAYRNVDLEMNKIATDDQTGNTALIGGSTPDSRETDYNYWCFAEDEWSTQAATGYPADRSVNYPSGQTPANNKVVFATSEAFKDAIGLIRTLDLTPPVLTMSQAHGGGCSTTTETTITVTLKLNEDGTAWCKVVRHNFDPPTILEILDADYSNTFTADTDNTILISGYDRPINSDHSYETPLVLATDYDIYCYATDDLCNNCKVTNGMPYTGAIGVLATECKTRTQDNTPPRMKFVAAESISWHQILITLQVDEGAKVWCGAWTSALNDAGNWQNDGLQHETAIEDWGAPGNGFGYDCYENTPAKRRCGEFWVYDLDDIEDGDTNDDVSSQAQYDAATWKYDQDVEIIVDGLAEEVFYPYIYCYAEDDEDQMTLGMVYDENASPPDWYGTAKTDPNKMFYHTSSKSGPQNVHTISQETGGIGSIQTLDESPPIFDKLMIQDPTAWNDRIIVTFTLNEDGTAYCRVTRSDSGETNLKINRILTADWSNVYSHPTSGPATEKTITITSLENALYSDPIIESQEYDIYCWAKDSAIDTAGNARPNYQTQSYVEQMVSDPDGNPNPAGGGTTKKVWVVDSTPPTMIFVSGEAIAEDTIQLTLQLNEPGTIWCTPVAIATATGEILNSDWGASQTCDETASALTPFPAPFPDCSPANGTGCSETPFEACIKGASNGALATSNGATFMVYVPEAYRNVDLEMNLIANSAQNGNSALIGGSTLETDYNYQCFAEDEWSTQAIVGAGTSLRSVHHPSLQTPTNNKITLATSEAFKTAIGPIKTLDLTPPIISMATSLGGSCSETTETTITVTLQLNEQGTAWCKVVRHNFDPPTILEILDADYSNIFSKDTDNTILISGYDRPINSDHSYETPLVLATDYDIYCYATDDLCNNCKVTNGVSYAHVLTTKRKTRTLDNTPPRMKYVAAESISKQQILITLQVDEGAQVWCGAWTTPRTWVDGAYNHEDDIEAVADAGNCFENTPAKRACGAFWVYDLDDIEDGDSTTDLVSTQAEYDAATWFANQDVEIIVDGLDEEVDYPYIYCFAEDDEDTLSGMVYDESVPTWYHTAKTSPNKMWFHTTGISNMPLGPQNTHTISQATGGIGTIQTLDESPPIFETLKIQDPTALDDRIVVTFTLNEDGTAWCRVTRSDSGETNLKINRILTADWSGIYAHPPSPPPTPGASDVTIEITSLESKAGSETIKQETQYDIYCWAKDSAVDTHNNARPNYQAQSYVETDVGANVMAVLGGKTQNVWVTDSTRPQMIYVASEAIAETTIQVTLQLDEPGTVWCAIARPNGAADQSMYCTEAELPSSSGCGGTGYLYETYIKGSITSGAVFTQQVHVPYVDYDLDLNLIQQQSTSNAQPLKALSGYKVYCFAEDNWDLESNNAPLKSINFNSAGIVQNKVDDTAVEALRDVIGTVVTLDTSPAAFLTSQIQQVDETQLQVDFTLDEVGTVYCKPVRKNFATPTLNEILAYGESVNCNPSCTMNVGAVIPLTPKTEYDVHCVSEDDNVYPQVTNLYQRPKLTQPTMDTTPPSIHIIEAESPYNDRIVVKLQLNEVGTVWCLSRPTADANTMTNAVIRANGNSEIVDNVGWYVDQNTQLVVTNLEEEIEYVTRCYAEDTPDGLHWSTPNVMTQAATTATQAVLGPIITLDVSPPKFTNLKMEGTLENQITVTFDLNEAGTAYCRATRSDSGEATMHINRILKADWSQTYVSTTQTIVIDRLENDASSSYLERGTYYDVFCWIRDAAVKHSCRAGPDGVTPAICGTTYTPVGQTQTYVDTQFGGTGNWKTPPAMQTGDHNAITGGLVASPGVRTRDTTPPTIIFVEAESTAETSITITLQLSEPGTVYCEAYTSTGTPAVKTDCTYASCQYVVSSWAETYRNFEVTVTKGTGLTKEVNHYVYCGGEDDESGETQYSLGQSNNGGTHDTNNLAPIFLTESGGRFTLDLTPPVLQVLDVSSPAEQQIKVNVELDEPGTVWCLAVRDNFDAPTINQIIAADYSTVMLNSNTPFDVLITDLTRDTEYDTYCFARDRGTENGAVSPNPGNDISFASVLVSKRDVHSVGDSTSPTIPVPPNPTGFQPPQNSVGIGTQETFVFTFSEDVTTSQAVQANPASAFVKFYDIDNTGANSKQIDFNYGATTDGSIVIVNNVMTVTFESSYFLNAATNYDVELADGVLVDSANNPFPGLGGATSSNTNPNRITYAVQTTR
jgi:hypothetical protein